MKQDKRFSVIIKNKVLKNLNKLPIDIQNKFFILVEDIREKGAIQSNWSNFSSLGNDKYHCHLNYHWVACWKWEKGTFVVEVYYAGSRENAPY